MLYKDVMMINRSDYVNLKRLTLTIAMIVSISLLTACNDDNETTVIIPDTNEPEDVGGCFWGGPYSIDNPESNFAYPDTGATYWHAKYSLPEGASLKLNGEFPYARYMSFNSYRQDNSPAFALRDQQILANNGSINPFTQGAERNNDKRSYQIELAAGQAPIIPPNNIVYDYAQDNNGEARLLYRVYVPNKGKDATGGVGLPTPELTLTNGQVLKGQSACDKLESEKELVKIRDLEISFQVETELWQQQLNQKKLQSLQRIEVIINQVIEEFAIAENYDLILYQNAAFATDEVNISKKIISKIEGLSP